MRNVNVITGGGSGMGFEIAKLLGKKEIVAICGRTKSKIDKAVLELKKEGMEAYGFTCDVTDKSSVKTFADEVAKLGNINVVINGAGVSPSMVDAKTLYTINMVGTVNIMDAFYPFMGKDKVMMNIASMAGHMVPMNEHFEKLFSLAGKEEFIDAALKIEPNVEAAYSISKRFVLEYTKSHCVKYAKIGARIISISPGAFNTPMVESEIEGEATQQTIKATPVGRMGEPKEIAYLTEFLVSDKAKFISGSDVLIDGGFISALQSKQID